MNFVEKIKGSKTYKGFASLSHNVAGIVVALLVAAFGALILSKTGATMTAQATAISISAISASNY